MPECSFIAVDNALHELKCLKKGIATIQITISIEHIVHNYWYIVKLTTQTTST